MRGEGWMRSIRELVANIKEISHECTNDGQRPDENYS